MRGRAWRPEWDFIISPGNFPLLIPHTSPRKRVGEWWWSNRQALSPSLHWQGNWGPEGLPVLLSSYTTNMLGKPGTDSSSVCFVNTAQSTAFFSEKRKWDQNKGLRQKAFTPTSSLQPNIEEEESHRVMKTLKPVLSCQSPHSLETLSPCWMAAVLCLNQGNTGILALQ